MSMSIRLPAPGVLSALLAAALFGLSTPFAKLLLADTGPVTLAGLMYLGAGIGLLIVRRLGSAMRRPDAETPLQAGDLPWLAGAIACGGVLGPVLLLWGLQFTVASSAALLLYLEGVFTALLAWFVFHENVDRRIALGMLLIVGGGVVLSWNGTLEGARALGALAIVGACLAWAWDNNLTMRISASDPLQIAGLKGLVAGVVNLELGMLLGQTLPSGTVALAAMLVGLLGYGLSLALFVWSLRHLGTARTGAYFSTAPFIGAATALLLLHESPSGAFWAAGALMSGGVWLHLTERHAHEHAHTEQAHGHPHRHDEHHQHTHDFEWNGREPHVHWHIHQPLIHSHPHFPDLHHRHRH